MPEFLRVLLLEDNIGDARLIRECVDGDGESIQLEHVERLAEATALVQAGGFDVVLTDLDLPDSRGIGTYRALRHVDSNVPIVVLSGSADRGLAVEAVQEGAQDYLVKGRVDGELLIRAIRYAIERQRLERQRRDFLALVSHELRNPLTSILGWAQAAQRYNSERAIPTIIEEARHLDRLICDLLDAARLDHNQLELRCWDLDLVALSQECIDSVAGRAENHEILLTTDDHSIMGFWDPDRVRQILENLLSNAIKYSPDGGRIRVSVGAHDGHAEISLTDEGVGLTSDALCHIFSRFYRTDTARHGSTPGIGLGLYITQALVEAHGGTIRASSPGIGHGSTFSFTLPLPSTLPARTTGSE